ncbi:hypothetical protein [Algibacter sp. Ld11]|uniref:hypothetical protein n=1 Tax=Algibacter sp. Ld11 TaxID=649150 RepID=UPI00386BF3CF
MDNKEEKINNKLEQVQNKIDKTIAKGKDVVDNAKQGAEAITNITTGIQNTLNSANNLAQSVNGIKDTFIESQKIQAITEIELKKIQTNHQQVNRVITEEYGKQKQSMDKASDVVDAGLQDNDLDKIREGLNAMTNVANHNPMAELKKSMDKQLEENLNKDLDDDDFMIEI